MSALARYALVHGITVTGYDRSDHIQVQRLKALGIPILHEPSRENVESATEIIYTPAVSPEFPELRWAKELQKPLFKRAEKLGKIVNSFPHLVTVAGTHGKTSISALLSYLLSRTKGVTAFVGGIIKQDQTNYYDTSNEIAVVEGDEYDKSFLYLRPHSGIISSIEPDHVEIYPDWESLKATFFQFIQQFHSNGFLIIHKNAYKSLGSISFPLKIFTYDFYGSELIQLDQISYSHLDTTLSIKDFTGQTYHFNMQILSDIQIENFIAVLTWWRAFGFPIEPLIPFLRKYQGVERRFEILHIEENRIWIDDYAHHPTEIKRLLEGVRKRFPHSEIVALFQPHLYSRTLHFAKEFAESLSIADFVYLFTLYPAREKPIPNVSEKLIYQHLDSPKTKLLSLPNLPSILNKKGDKHQVFLSIGAGDLSEHIRKLLKYA